MKVITNLKIMNEVKVEEVAKKSYPTPLYIEVDPAIGAMGRINNIVVRELENGLLSEDNPLWRVRKELTTLLDKIFTSKDEMAVNLVLSDILNGVSMGDNGSLWGKDVVDIILVSQDVVMLKQMLTLVDMVEPIVTAMKRTDTYTRMLRTSLAPEVIQGSLEVVRVEMEKATSSLGKAMEYHASFYK